MRGLAWLLRIVLLIAIFAVAACSSPSGGGSDSTANQESPSGAGTPSTPTTPTEPTTPEDPSGSGNSHWSTLGSGMDNNVRAMVFDSSGNLYAGGSFTTTNGITVNHIAKWDGTAWSALGSGLNDTVMALAIDAAGNLYAGGYFTKAYGVNGAGDTSALHIAMWDGSKWSKLRSGMDADVRALVCDAEGNVYAGGLFDKANDATVNHVAKWDGSTWSALGAGLNGTSMIPVEIYALALDKAENLYACGQYSINGVSTVQKWNRSSWSAMAGISGTLSALAFDSSGNLYAGGIVNKADGTSMNCIAKWDGSSWSALGSGIDGALVGNIASVDALACDSSGNVYVGGDFLTAGGSAAHCIAKWNGSSWDSLGTGADEEVNSLACDAEGTLYVGGDFSTIDGISAQRIAVYKK